MWMWLIQPRVCVARRPCDVSGHVVSSTLVRYHSASRAILSYSVFEELSLVLDSGAFVKAKYPADVFEPGHAAAELKYPPPPPPHSDNGTATAATSTIATHAQTSTSSTSRDIPSPKRFSAESVNKKFTEYSPGSSPEPEMKPDAVHQRDPAVDLNSPKGTRSDSGDHYPEDLGKFPNPKNVCAPIISSNGKPETLTRDSIQNRATFSRSDESYKRPRSVLVKPTSLHNEPTGMKNWFKRDAGVPNEKFRKITKVAKTDTVIRKERNLKTSLDEPGANNETCPKNDLADSPMTTIRPFVDNTPRIQLPKRIINENVQQETIYQNVQLVQHPHPEMFQNGETGHGAPTVAYVTTGHPQAQTPIQLQPREVTPVHRDISALPIQYAAPQVASGNSKPVYWIPCHKIEEHNKVEYVKIPDTPVFVALHGKLVPEDSVSKSQMTQVAPNSPKFVSVNNPSMGEQQVQTIIIVYMFNQKVANHMIIFILVISSRRKYGSDMVIP